MHPDAGVLAEAVASRLLTRILDIQSVRTPVHVVLTGGTVGIRSLAALAAHPCATPSTGQVSTSGGATSASWRRETPSATRRRRARRSSTTCRPCPRRTCMPCPRRGRRRVPEESAALYATELSRFTPDGATHLAFDVLLLGMGPDGHVASLFRGTPPRRRRVATGVHDSQAAPERVSLTFSAIQAAQEVWVVAAGAERLPPSRRRSPGTP
ncbi:6-phosphogluconolactonase [Oerskovia sp. M15]